MDNPLLDFQRSKNVRARRRRASRRRRRRLLWTLLIVAGGLALMVYLDLIPLGQIAYSLLGR